MVTQPLAIQAIDLAGPARFVRTRQARELHRARRGGWDRQTAETLGIGAKRLVRPQPYVELLGSLHVSATRFARRREH